MDPQMQNLFEMSYFSDAKNSDGAIATGWSVIDETRQFPSLSSRLPESGAPVDQDSPGTESWANGNGSDNGSGSDEASGNVASQTRMAEESSEEEVVSYKVNCGHAWEYQMRGGEDKQGANRSP